MLNALAPIFLIIILGFILKNYFLFDNLFWKLVEKLTYFIFFPSLLFENLSQTSWNEISAVPMLAALLLTIGILSITMYLIKPWIHLAGPAFSSVFQGGIRFNSFVGLAGVSALLGEQGLALAAVALMGMIPLVNLLSVPTIAGFSTLKKGNLSSIALEVIKNPLIIACIAGFLMSINPYALPYAISQVFDLLGRAALPLGLLAVGAGLQITSSNLNVFSIGMTSVMKLLMNPGCTTFFCLMFGVTGPPLTVAVLFAGLPTAPSAYILSKQLGGDYELMAALITAQTALSAITLPTILFLFT
jgi:hypothetical protein